MAGSRRWLRLSIFLTPLVLGVWANRGTPYADFCLNAERGCGMNCHNDRYVEECLPEQAAPVPENPSAPARSLSERGSFFKALSVNNIDLR